MWRRALGGLAINHKPTRGGWLAGAVAAAGAFGAVTYSNHSKRQLHMKTNQRLFMDHDIGVPVEIPTVQLNTDSKKQHVVILGTGWASIALIKTLDPKQFDITVVSPTNYFLFTPLLPSCSMLSRLIFQAIVAVGTVHINSVTEPVRSILNKSGWSAETVERGYIEASAIDVEYVDENQKGANRVLCQTADGQQFYVPYDKCVVAVGSKSVTFGVEGVDKHCLFLKTVEDVRKIRRKILLNFETAARPLITDEERKQLLTFVVCGGGPTGVEFAAELHDFLMEDAGKIFAHLVDEVSIYIIQSQDHILNTYDQKISVYAQNKFSRNGVQVLTKSRVTLVKDGQLTYSQITADKKLEMHTLPFGLCIWTTGVGMQPICERLNAKIEEQKHQRALVVDDRMRIKGIPYDCHGRAEDDYSHGNVFSIGDCATVDVPHLNDRILQLFKDGDRDGSGSLSYEEFKLLAQDMRIKYPQTALCLQKLTKLFKQYDQDHSGALEYKEFEQMLTDINKKIKSYPATAQVAQQQGRYLGRFLNWTIGRDLQALEGNEQSNDSDDVEDDEDLPDIRAVAIQSSSQTAHYQSSATKEFYPPFYYHHLGSLAYIGMNSAVIDLGHGVTLGSSDTGGVLGRLVTFWLWRGVYLSEVVSLRQRVLLASDWIMTSVFGREIARF